MKEYSIDCAIARGGTTKGIYIDSRQLPDKHELRDRIVLALFGSPDLRQINGLGGADPLTSKVAYVLPSSHPDADVDYQSGEVGIDEAVISYSTMCGNLASGAAIFAYTSGMVPNQADDRVLVRIRNLNTGKFLNAEFELNGKQPTIAHCKGIDGVPGFGTPVSLNFLDPEGPITGQLLPTSHASDILKLRSRELKISIVDCGTLYAFISAEDLGLLGTETPETIDANLSVRELIEEVRGKVAELISTSLDKQYREKQIKIALVSSNPQTGTYSDADIQARIVNRFKTHKAYAVTGAICISAAAAISNTIVNLAIKHSHNGGRVKIAHPSGIIETSSTLNKVSDLKIRSVSIARSARILIKGNAQVFVDE